MSHGCTKTAALERGAVGEERDEALVVEVTVADVVADLHAPSSRGEAALELRHARSVSCSGTWAIGTSRPSPAAHSSRRASLKMRAHSIACSAGRP